MLIFYTNQQPIFHPQTVLLHTNVGIRWKGSNPRTALLKASIIAASKLSVSALVEKDISSKILMSSSPAFGNIALTTHFTDFVKSASRFSSTLGFTWTCLHWYCSSMSPAAARNFFRRSNLFSASATSSLNSSEDCLLDKSLTSDLMLVCEELNSSKQCLAAVFAARALRTTELTHRTEWL